MEQPKPCNSDHPLDHRLEPLRQRKSRRLQGPDAEEWRLEVEQSMPESLKQCFPSDALVFANNGYGDYLFLVHSSMSVMVFRHDEQLTEEYCQIIDELLPNKKRPPSNHPPIRYLNSNEVVTLGDRVHIRYWLFFSGAGTVTYVPGISPLKRDLERDGLSWVRIKSDKGLLIDTIVIGGMLKKVRVSLNTPATRKITSPNNTPSGRIMRSCFS